MVDYGDRKKSLLEIERVIEKGPFHDNWASLSNYKVPDWYKNAKFGIFVHWGVYSIPAFSNEWYPRSMYIKDSPEYNHHIETYGSHIDFGYKDFIPMFKAERFHADGWAELFKKAGAKYIVPVAEHHDGFQMYNSRLSHWNSVEMGPKRDVLGELSIACAKRGLVNCASSHRIEHWFFMGEGKNFDSDVKEPLNIDDLYWPAMPKSENLHDMFSEPVPSHEFLEDWLLRSCEIVDNYKPKIMYFDWWIQHASAKPYLKKFAAYYYNRAAEWGDEVAINYKHDAYKFGCAVPDIERGQFAEIKHYFWQTDTAVAKNSWCYTENNEYKTSESIICDLVDIVSKNGTLLLNIGPKADGTIPDEDAKILLEIGEWLDRNGEAIYDTDPWRIAGEGSTKVKEGQFTDAIDKVFTPEDIRFTTKGEYLYATVLKCPNNGLVKIKELAERDASNLAVFNGIIKDVDILGFGEKPVYKRSAEALEIQTDMRCDKPIVFRILID